MVMFQPCRQFRNLVMVAGAVGAGVGFHQPDDIGIAAFDKVRYLFKMFAVSL